MIIHHLKLTSLLHKIYSFPTQLSQSSSMGLTLFTEHGIFIIHTIYFTFSVTFSRIHTIIANILRMCKANANINTRNGLVYPYVFFLICQADAGFTLTELEITLYHINKHNINLCTNPATFIDKHSFV